MAIAARRTAILGHRRRLQYAFGDRSLTPRPHIRPKPLGAVSSSALISLRTLRVALLARLHSVQSAPLRPLVHARQCASMAAVHDIGAYDTHTQLSLDWWTMNRPNVRARYTLLAQNTYRK